jgi:RNA polymerase sigma-70 factor (ECF subfamily)
MGQLERSRPPASPKERPWLDLTGSAGLGTLLLHVGRGDQAALEALYATTAPSVFGMLNRVLDDRSQAERLMLRIYVQIWRTATRYDPVRDTPPAGCSSSSTSSSPTPPRTGRSNGTR